MQNVVVAIVETGRGMRRTAVTDSGGQYRLTGLSPANYEVSAAMPGFESQVQKNVALNLGETVVVDFRMTVSARREVVEVTSDPPFVDTARASQADIVEEHSIRDLPIDRRDYLTFTLLMPGVSDANTLADNADFRVKQTPQSGLSFYGSNGRGNNITVDGGEANDDAGGVRLNLSQDAVQEFQINHSNYSAELGNASGASVNIATKSGTNTLHASLYGFFRNDAMDARDPFAFSPALEPGQFSLTASGLPIKNGLNRQQFGGTIGFPIKKDKTFLFIGCEYMRSDSEHSVPLLTSSNIFAPTAGQQSIAGGLTAQGNSTQVPCLSGPVGAAVAAELGFPAPNPATSLPAATCAAVLNGALTVSPTTGPLSAFVVNQFEKDGGLFPFPIRQHEASARLDHRFDNSDQVWLRYSFAHLQESDPDVQSLI